MKKASKVTGRKKQRDISDGKRGRLPAVLSLAWVKGGQSGGKSFFKSFRRSIRKVVEGGHRTEGLQRGNWGFVF